MASRPLYLAINQSDIPPKHLRSLTPRVMLWNEDTWLMDLAPCLSYWQAKAKMTDRSLLELCQEVLKPLTSDSPRVGVAPHPWQAILLVHILKEKSLKGFINYASSFGRSLFQQLSWEIWWACTLEARDHLVKAGQKKVTLKNLNREIRLMQRAIQKLRLQQPKDLNHISALGIKRRFGPTISTLWEWAFPQEIHRGGEPFGSDFPFLPFQFSQRPQEKRNLDFPLMDWDHMEPLLQHDLNRLCQHPSYSTGDLVTSLEWCLVLQDMSELPISILFRHPHDLRRNSPLQQAALLQAFYNFEASSQQHFQHYNDAEIPPPPVVSWKLTIDGLMPRQYNIKDLFNDTQGDEQRLQELENLLPVPLTSYGMVQDWCAEDAFSPHHPHEKDTHSALDPSLKVLNQTRPLFIYRQPQPLPARPQSSLWRFLERSMDKWWSHPQHNARRDYYLMVNHQKSQLWVFQDHRGQWYIHGVFA